MNRVVLFGRLTTDGELKQTQGGVTVYNNSIAVNRMKKDDPADFFKITAFNKPAELISQYFHKGQRILVEGVLRQEQWTAKDGGKRSTVSVIVNNFEFIEPKTSGNNGNFADDAPSVDNFDPDEITDDEVPF